MEGQHVDRADDAARTSAAVLDEDLGLLGRGRADILGEERSRRRPQVALAVWGVLQQLPVPAEVALRWRDVGVALDAVGA
jgi:hypothetical protein